VRLFPRKGQQERREKPNNGIPAGLLTEIRSSNKDTKKTQQELRHAPTCA
jgi:hypothetical protein